MSAIAPSPPTGGQDVNSATTTTNALGARLTDLESEAFQLKLRNYYLERRLNASLSERDANAARARELLEEAEEEEEDEDEAARVRPVATRQDHAKDRDLALGRSHGGESPEDQRWLLESADARTPERKKKKKSSGNREGNNDNDQRTAHQVQTAAAIDALVDALERERAKVRLLEEARAHEVGKLKQDADGCKAALNTAESARDAARAERDEAVRLLAAARDDCERWKAELDKSRRSAEDVVAFEAEQIADLSRRNESLTKRLRDFETLRDRTHALERDAALRTRASLLATQQHDANDAAEAATSSTAGAPPSVVSRRPGSTRASELRADVDRSFDWLDAHAAEKRGSAMERGSSSRLARCVDYGADLARESRRRADERELLHSMRDDEEEEEPPAERIKRLLLETREVVLDAVVPKNVAAAGAPNPKPASTTSCVDPRLADCVDLAIRFADRSARRARASIATLGTSSSASSSPRGHLLASASQTPTGPAANSHRVVPHRQHRANAAPPTTRVVNAARAASSSSQTTASHAASSRGLAAAAAENRRDHHHHHHRRSAPV